MKGISVAALILMGAIFYVFLQGSESGGSGSTSASPPHSTVNDPPSSAPAESSRATPAATNTAEPPAESDRDAPIEVIRSIVHRNSAGTSELDVLVRNLTSKTIDGVEIEAVPYNNFNERVLNRYTYRRESDPNFTARGDQRIGPRARRRLGTWSMFDFDGTTKAIVTVTRVHFTDNTEWRGVARQMDDPRRPETETR